ncbi:MAG TPA: hypothetical protein VG965_07280 [Patescibacteria group bacterium]|nr:hypothetical protein [Patescibacteria group bacterium]
MKKSDLKIDFMLLCDYASISQEGKLSAMGIFEELRTLNNEAVLNRGFLVAAVSGKSATSYDLRIIAASTQDEQQVLPQMEMKINTGINGKSNLVIELVGVKFGEEGEYDFSIFLGREKIGTTKLRVIRLKTPDKPEKLTN